MKCPSRLTVPLTAFLLAAALLTATLLTACKSVTYTITPSTFTYQTATVPNPMKGFAGFYEKAERDKRHDKEPDKMVSLEYVGLLFRDVYSVKYGEGKLNSDYIDTVLQSVAKRGNQAILRVLLFNPDNNTDECHGLFLPDELLAKLQTEEAIYSNQYGGHLIEYPDFNNATLLGYMTDFVGQFGAVYDGNPAIAAVQMGLYGSWGEWNMSGCTHQRCAMRDENLRQLIAAYTDAFSVTKLMGRNPSLGDAHDFAIGYHDDNFLFNCSDFHRQSKAWKALMRRCDPSYATIQQFYDFMDGQNGQYAPLWELWKTQMFGGELSGMLNQDPFGPIWSGTEREAFDYCVRQFHVSWLMGTGRDGIPAEDSPLYNEYMKVCASFGYDLSIAAVSAKNHTGKIVTTFTNTGIAPFYYDWPLEYQVINAAGETVYSERDAQFRLSALLPEEEQKSIFFLPEEMEVGEYEVLVRFVNPAEQLSANAKPLKLSNDNAVRGGVYRIATVNVQ